MQVAVGVEPRDAGGHSGAGDAAGDADRVRAIAFKEDGESIGIAQHIGDGERSSFGDAGEIGDDVTGALSAREFNPCRVLNLVAEFAADRFESVIEKRLWP